MIFPASWIASQLGLPSPRGDAGFARIVTDSRKVGASDLFVAIRGEAFDGHDFIEASIQKGATGILCEKDRIGELASRHPGVAFFGRAPGVRHKLKHHPTECCLSVCDRGIHRSITCTPQFNLIKHVFGQPPTC